MLPFVGLVPLTLWLTGRPDGDRGVLRGGLLFGATYFGLMAWWLLPALLRLSWLGAPAFFAGLGLVSVLTAGFVVVLHRAVLRSSAPLWLAVPVVWTAFEWTCGHLPGGLAFPWLGLGTSLTGTPELVGIAEVVGARGVTFWIALVNGLVAALVVTRSTGRPVLGQALLCLAVLLLPPAWGVWRAATLETLDVARVAVVQPNVGYEERRDPALARDRTLAALDRLVPDLEPGSVSLVVLPEMTFPEEHDSALSGIVQTYAADVGAPLLYGARGSLENVARPTNSVWLTGPRGAEPWRYDKRRLVPLAERAPLPLPLAGADVGYAAGEDHPLLEVAGAGYGVLVCYESAWPSEARAWRRAGADVLVNVTSDAWFGDGPFGPTPAVWQHPAHLVMRAIEHRVSVVRSAGTGISLAVDPLGRIHDPLAYGAEGVRVFPVTTTNGETLFTRWGDIVGPACAVAFLVLLVRTWRGPHRRLRA